MIPLLTFLACVRSMQLPDLLYGGALGEEGEAGQARVQVHRLATVQRPPPAGGLYLDLDSMDGLWCFWGLFYRDNLVWFWVCGDL